MSKTPITTEAPISCAEPKPAAVAADKAPALETSKSRRAMLGLMLELLGIGAVVLLCTKIFQEPWLVVSQTHWALLAFSGLTFIGFVLSVSAMFQQRRQLAVLGVWLGILGSITAATCGTILLATTLELWGPRPEADMIRSTRVVLAEIMADVRNFVDEHEEAPTQEQSVKVLAGREDAWGTPFRYMSHGFSNFEVSSAGPDQTHGSADDIIDFGY